VAPPQSQYLTLDRADLQARPECGRVDPVGDHHRIDAVAGIIETSRPDAKNAQYLQVIKLGDAVLNKVQKLSRSAAL
jgi:hypothetical protein